MGRTDRSLDGVGSGRARPGSTQLDVGQQVDGQVVPQLTVMNLPEQAFQRLVVQLRQLGFRKTFNPFQQEVEQSELQGLPEVVDPGERAVSFQFDFL